jgi:trehalose 2-sulfotransferase
MSGPPEDSTRLPPRLSYVIACTPRTGSHLLCAALAATNVAGKPAEHISAFKPDALSQLRKAVDETTTPNGVYGIKLHWHQFAYAVRDLRRLAGPPDTSPADLVTRHLGHTKWIHLRRQGTAQQALSYYRAICSGVWRVPAGGKVSWAPPNPDLQHVAWLEDMFREHEDRWLQFFSQSGIQTLDVTYEELDAEYERTAAEALQHLGLEVPETSLSGPRPLEVLADDWTKKWLEVYRSQRDDIPAQEAERKWSNVDVLSPRPPAAPAKLGNPDGSTSPPTVRYSCVVRAHPRFEYESWIWVLTLLHLAQRDASELVVHAHAGVRRGYLARLRELGIEVVRVEQGSETNSLGDKLSQLYGPDLDAEVLVLTDCDLAFVSDPSPLLLPDAIGVTIAHDALPSYNMWLDLIERAGMEADGLALERALPGLRWTYANNPNSNFISVPRALVSPLRDCWSRWTGWVETMRGPSSQLPDRHFIFGPWVGRYVDRIGFALAMAELGLRCTILPAQVNDDIQAPFVDRDEEDNPLVLRYGRRLSKQGLLRSTGLGGVDHAIDAVNALISTPESRKLMAASKARWRRDGDPPRPKT